jgi:predicted NBD/HSP70 family sugar kinase
MSYSIGSKSLIRELNRAAVLNLISHEGPIARVTIARRLRLSAAAVTSIANELEGLGLIRQVAQAPSLGGRPAELLALNPNAAAVIGIKLADDHLAGVLGDLTGAVMASETVVVTDHAVERVSDRIDELVAALRTAGPRGRRLLGIGIGMPGVVDGPRGTCVRSPILSWENVPLADRLSARFGAPVLIDNDVNTLAVAESLYGAGRNVPDFVTVTLGRGVGLGIVVDGRLYRGRRGGAGEFGHLPVVTDGPRCECGRHGCLEALVADRALVAEGRRAGVLDDRDDIEALVDRADRGEVEARRIFATAGVRLGVAVAGLVNVLSPSLVIVSGEGMRAQRHLEPSLRSAMADRLFPPLAGVELLIDPWDDAKWARGGAALVLENFFSVGRQDTMSVPAVDLATFVSEAV